MPTRNKPDIIEDAMIFIESIRSALRHGVKHFDIRGNRLITDVEIVEALLRDKRIVLEEPDANANM